MAQEHGAMTALITDASSGIGYELTQLFARDAYHLVLVARDEQKLAALAAELIRTYGIRVRVVVKDLTRPAAAQEVFAELRQDSITVDILVNNAGTAGYGAFATSDLTYNLNMMQLNMVAVIQLTKFYLEQMRAEGERKILNVASTAAFQPGPGMAVYYASKAFVLSFSEAMSEELRGSGVMVTVLCPGPTQTAIQQRAGLDRIRLMQGRIMDAQTVARIGYRGLRNNRRVVIAGWDNILLAMLVRVMPSALVLRIIAWLSREVKPHPR